MMMMMQRQSDMTQTTLERVNPEETQVSEVEKVSIVGMFYVPSLAGVFFCSNAYALDLWLVEVSLSVAPIESSKTSTESVNGDDDATPE